MSSDYVLSVTSSTSQNGLYNTYIFDATADNITFTLSDISTLDGVNIKLVRIDSTVNSINIIPFGSQLINGSSSASLLVGTQITINSLGGQWYGILTNISGNVSIFGTGADGNVTISTNTTLVADMNYNNLTINDGVTLNSAGYKIYVKGILNTNTTGTISNAGGNGTYNGSTSTAGGAGGGTGTLGGGGNGGASGAANGTNSGTTGSVTGGAVNTQTGGVGGIGGTVASGRGGASGGASGGTTNTGSVQIYPGVEGLINVTNTSGTLLYGGSGGGGGGGGTGGEDAGGSGGGGGGGMMVVAFAITCSGFFTVNGGNGANANGTGAFGSGGGGGGAGFIIIVYYTNSMPFSHLTATGGTAGTGNSNNPVATAGTNGTIISTRSY